MDRTILSSYNILIITVLPFYFLISNCIANSEENQYPDYLKEVSENEYVASAIYDRKGRRVKITFNKDQTVTFSPNSSPEIIELVNGLAKTQVGFNTLKLISASVTKIILEVDTINIKPIRDGNISAAETYPIISTPVDKFGRPIGTNYISKAKIIIYEATIKDLIAKNAGRISINGVLIDTKKFSISDIVASYSIHEFMHVLDNKSSGALNPMTSKTHVEKKPYQTQLQYLKEIEEQNKVK